MKRAQVNQEKFLISLKNFDFLFSFGPSSSYLFSTFSFSFSNCPSCLSAFLSKTTSHKVKIKENKQTKAAVIIGKVKLVSELVRAGYIKPPDALPSLPKLELLPIAKANSLLSNHLLRIAEFDTLKFSPPKEKINLPT